MLSNVCTLSAYYLEDSEICVDVFFKALTLFYFFGDFFLGPPFAKSQKMRDFGTFGKFAITLLCFHFWSRCSRQNVFRSLHFKCVVLRSEGVMAWSGIHYNNFFQVTNIFYVKIGFKEYEFSLICLSFMASLRGSFCLLALRARRERNLRGRKWPREILAWLLVPVSRAAIFFTN